MSNGFKASVAILAVFVLSVLLTPPIYAILFPISPFFKFERIFNRLVMVFSIVAAVLFVVVPQIKKGGMFRDWTIWKDYGFDFSAPWKKLVAYGFLGGAVTVLVLAVIEVAFGPRYLRQPVLFQDVIERLVKGTTSGLIVGIVEEFFFRGFIFTHLRRTMGNVFSPLILTSAFYSLAHFFDNGQIFIPKDPSFGDAIWLLLGYLEPIVKHFPVILPEFTGLFLFGILLNEAFIRTRSLFLSIGIHAGAVFLIKFQHSFVRLEPNGYHPLFGQSSYSDAPIEWLMLVVLGCVVWWFTRQNASVDS
ncbi:MAG: hypothetical protein A3C35_02630 [Omnitrophica bacterium RIFCSPHIGHO2_02_FULL_46_11]|nr:MAG: hypothetical protein A3C35_02630 [Omnitrophica bacterium RIFCSPHIGHO2_02_FULL_46_11]